MARIEPDNVTWSTDDPYRDGPTRRRDRIVIPRGAVGVWTIRLDDPAWRGVVLAPLSAAERRRAARFRFAIDRDRFVARRLALRAILARCLGTRPGDLVFGAGAHGKPFLRSPRTPLRFSVSRAGALALVAVSRDADVGVDVERWGRRRGLGAMIARACTPWERDRLRALPAASRAAAFLRAWTLKEAYLKACGEGLTRDLRAIEVSAGPRAGRVRVTAHDRPGEGARWRLCPLVLAGGYAGALAVARLSGARSAGSRRSPPRTAAPSCGQSRTCSRGSSSSTR